MASIISQSGPLAATGVLWLANFSQNGGLNVIVKDNGGGSTILVETSSDNTTWTTIQTITAKGRYFVDASDYIRVRVSAYVSGTVDIDVDESAVSATSAITRRPTLSNFRTDNLKRWRKALGNVRSGSAPARVACIGTSNTAGRGSGTGAENLTGARLKSYPAYLAAILDKQVGAHANNVFGSAAVTSPLTAAYDSRMAFGAGWAASGLTCLGGPIWVNSTDTTALAFTPTEPIDTIDVYYLRNAGLAQFTVDVDGGAAAATVTSQIAAGTIIRLTTTVTLGNHTINIKRNGTGGALYIIGIDAYNSATKRVHVLNMGWSGSTAAQWNNSTAYLGVAGGLPAVAPDLSIIEFGLNEAIATVDRAAFMASVQSVIDVAKVTGDVVLMLPQRPNTTWNTTDRFDAIVASYYALSAVNDLPMIDLSQRLDYATHNPSGFYTDAAHPTAAGYADIAQLVARALLV